MMKARKKPTNKKIPFKKVNLGNALEYITPLIKSGNIGLGEVVTSMEKELAKYVGSKYAIAVDSCTSAIFLSLLWEKNHHNVDVVNIPSMTVPLALNAVKEAGMDVILDSRTDWVGKYYRIKNSCVYDSAHELRRDQFKIIKRQSKADIKLCFSFYPTKTIGSADGGAIATDDNAFATWARSISTYGRSYKTKYSNSWDYDIEMIGYKRHYTNLQAAIVLEQLNRLDETNKKRRKIVDMYNKAFLLQNDSDYLYRISIDNRDKFIKYMTENGVECGVHFKPLHLMKPYKNIPVLNRKKIEQDYLRTVSLPLYDTMKDEEVRRIICLVQTWLFYHK